MTVAGTPDMFVPMRYIVIPALLAILFLLPAACSDQPLLRDDYMGKWLLQPDKLPHSQERDENGNPIQHRPED